MSRRRKNHLKVTTFPFIAVLLCAMGALILLLLIMDRQAKLAARMKVTREAEERAQREKAVRQTEQKHQRQRIEQEKRNRKLRLRQLAQKKALEEELARISLQDAQVSEELNALDKTSRLVSKRLAEEEKKAKQLQEYLARQRVALAQKTYKTENTHKNLKLAKRQVTKFEAELERLKEAKAAEARSYSLIPYGGRKGDNRKPIYIECRSSGIVFHPEKLALEGSWFTAGLVKRHLQQRLTKYENPYVFFLVRPDGLESYYLLKDAVGQTDVDFGYELIEQDWILNVSGTGPAFRKKTNTAFPALVPKGDQIGKGRFASDEGVPKNASFRGAKDDTQKQKNGHGTRSVPTTSGHGTRSVPTTSGHGTRSVPTTSTQGQASFRGAKDDTLKQKPGAGKNEGLDIPVVIPTKKGFGIKRRTPYGIVWTPHPETGNKIGSGDKTGTKAGTEPPPPRGLLLPPQGKGKARSTQHANGQGPRTDQPTAKPTRKEFRDPEKKQTNGGKSANSAGVPGGGAQKGQPTPRHVRRDWIIPVVCKKGVATVPHLRQSFSASSFVPSKTVHPMVRGIYDLIRRRQLRSRPRRLNFRPVIRFEVHPDGLGTFHGASWLLEGLGVAMQRENILPDRPRLSEYYRKE